MAGKVKVRRHLREINNERKIKISVKRPIGYRISDIGAGGKEYNVKEVGWTNGQIKGWKKINISRSDREFGIIELWKQRYNGRGYPQTIELKKQENGNYHLIGAYWDVIFKNREEAHDYAIQWMKSHPNG